MRHYTPFSNGSEQCSWYESNCAVCVPKCPKKRNVDLSFVTGTINQTTADWIGYDKNYNYKDFIQLNPTCQHFNKYVRPKKNKVMEKEIRKLSEEQYGNDMHMWAKQREGFCVGFQQGIDSANKWTKCTEEMPKKHKVVLIFGINEYKKERVLRAFYVPKYSMSEEYAEYHGDCDYHEEKDEYFWPEGWYENNEVEEVHYLIPFKILDWQELPERPKKI